MNWKSEGHAHEMVGRKEERKNYFVGLAKDGKLLMYFACTDECISSIDMRNHTSRDTGSHAKCAQFN